MSLENRFTSAPDGAATYVDSSDYYVVPERIFLAQSRFVDRTGPMQEPDALPEDLGFFISIGMHRLSRYRLTVTVTVAYDEEDAPFDLAVTYGAEFRMHDTVPSDKIEGLWKYVAQDLAVKVLYPYLRQAVSDLTEKWRGDKVYLPFIPIPLDEDEGAEFVVPLPADAAQVSLVDELTAG